MDGLRAAPEQPTPPPIGRVLQDSSLYLLGNMASRVVGFFAIPFYARFLTPAQYGLIELVELSTQTIAIALGLQAIGAALSRLFHDQPTRDQEQAVVSTSLIATAVLSAVVTILAVAGAGQLSQVVFHTDAWTGLLRAAFIAMFFSNMTEVVLVYERIRNNARFFLHYTLITLAVNLGLNILFIGFMDAGVWGFVSSKLVVSVFGSAYLLYRMRRDVGWHWRSLYVPELVRFGAPLVLSSLSYFAIHFSDRFFLSASVSLAELGRYALAYKFAILVSALVGDSFAKSWNATLYRYTNQDGWQPQFARIASYFTMLLFSTGLGIALFSPELLRVMVPEAYFPPALLLPIIIASYLAREIGDFFRSLMLINKRSVLVGQIAAGGAVLNLAANFVLIPWLGIYGAALATLITWVAYMVACWVVADREHRLPVRVDAYVRIAVLVTVVYALSALTRTHAMVPQLLMDGFWLAVFVAAALGLFFSSEERQGAMGFAGSLLLWAFARTTSARVPGSAARADDGPWQMLMISYDELPQTESGGARPHRFARLLNRNGVDVTVVEPVVKPGAPDAAAGPAQVVHLPGVRLARRTRSSPVAGLADASRLTRYGAAVLHVADRLLMPCHDRLGWFPYAYAAAVQTLAPNTVLFSTHPPTVSHLTALALKHRHGHPWIADFRSPLVGIADRTSRRQAMIARVIERLTVAHADAVIAGTEASAAVLRERYPAMRHKVHTIWDGYDPEDVIEPVTVPDRARRAIAHVGTLHGDRTLLALALSVQRLLDRGAFEAGAVLIRQVGRVDPACADRSDARLAALESRGCVSVEGEVLSDGQARAEMLGADWLLLLDRNGIDVGLQVPAETYDAIRSGRPILALTAPGSSIGHVLAVSGVPHVCIDPSGAAEAIDAAVLAFLQAAHPADLPGAAFLADFAAPQQVQALIAIVERIRAGVLAGGV